MRWTRCPKGIRKNKEAVAETIENNVRKLIIDESPINPKYYEKMSELLDALIEQRRQEALDYQEYLAKIVELTKQAKKPAPAARPIRQRSTRRPSGRSTTTSASDEALALAVDHGGAQTAGRTTGAATAIKTQDGCGTAHPSERCVRDGD